MKMTIPVSYTDGTSEMLEFEKPPGAHPESMKAVLTGLLIAERSGKTVATIGRESVTRGNLLAGLSRYSPQEYERYFGALP
jgi:hypothetical protein